MLANRTGGAMVKTGGDSWFFITADYAFGHALERDTANFIKAQGGKVVGSVALSLPGDHGLLRPSCCRRRPAGAKVLGLANAATDTVNCIKQAQEFGLASAHEVRRLLMGMIDVHVARARDGAGPAADRELLLGPERPHPRASTKRVQREEPGPAAGHVQAGCYGAVLHYLKAVADMGVTARRPMASMRSTA